MSKLMCWVLAGRQTQLHSDVVIIDRVTVTGSRSTHACFFETDAVRLEGTCVPHGQFFKLQINLSEWSMGRRVESEEHETSLFLSEGARYVIPTAYDRLERTR